MREPLRQFERVPLGQPDLKQEQWFEAGLKIGHDRELERIIKLLEEQWLPIADVDSCIALIKGENK